MCQVAVCLSVEEMEALEVKAAGLGLSLNGYVRQILGLPVSPAQYSPKTLLAMAQRLFEPGEPFTVNELFERVVSKREDLSAFFVETESVSGLTPIQEQRQDDLTGMFKGVRSIEMPKGGEVGSFGVKWKRFVVEHPDIVSVVEGDEEGAMTKYSLKHQESHDQNGGLKPNNILHYWPQALPNTIAMFADTVAVDGQVCKCRQGYLKNGDKCPKIDELKRLASGDHTVVVVKSPKNGKPMSVKVYSDDVPFAKNVMEEVVLNRCPNCKLQFFEK